MKNDRFITRVREAQLSGESLHKLSLLSSLQFTPFTIINYIRKKMLKSKYLTSESFNNDFNINTMFIENAAKTSPLKALFATIYLHLTLSILGSFDSIFPVPQDKVLSKYSKINENPLDITSIYRAVNSSLRKIAIVQALNRKDSIFSDLQYYFRQNIIRNLNNPFKYNPTDDLNMILHAEVFSALFAALGKSFISVFFVQLFYAPVNRYTYHLFLDAEQKIKARDIKISPRKQFIKDMKFIDTLAKNITEQIDVFTRIIDDEQDSAPNMLSPAQRPVQNSFNLNFLLANSLSDLNSSLYSRTSRTILGKSYPIVFRPSLDNQNDFSSRSSKLQSKTNSLKADLLKIHVDELDSFIRYRQSTGFLDKRELWKVIAAQDSIKADIFKSISHVSLTKNQIYLHLLVDNSCSMNPDKRKVVRDILTMLTNIILQFPNMFVYVSAAAQHSEGNKEVTIRKTFDGPVENVSVNSLSRIIHTHQQGLNYDGIALYELIAQNSYKWEEYNAIPVVIMIGDAWPVSHSEDVKQEQAKIIAHLKQRHPELILMYIAINQCYNPEELSYDYFVSIKSNDLIAEFLIQFKKMISKIFKE
ncbi:hypothetical protein ACFLSX_05465 [Calditrichota bacterium]